MGFSLPKQPDPDDGKPLMFNQPVDFGMAHSIAMRFAEIGFNPDTVVDRPGFGFLFLHMKNCLCIVRHNKGPAKGRVKSHFFLNPKTK